MVNRVQEYKIIALQAVIFVSLLLVLSFILEGCTLNKENIDKVDVENHEMGYELIHDHLFAPLS